MLTCLFFIPDLYHVPRPRRTSRRSDAQGGRRFAAQVPRHRHRLVRSNTFQLLAVSTSPSLTLLLSRSFHEDHPHQLVAQQDTHWNPLLQWVRDTYKVDVKVYEGILNTRQTDATILKLGAIVGEYDQFKLAGSSTPSLSYHTGELQKADLASPTAFERAVLASKSYIIALALVEGHLSVDAAAKAAHVEVQSQIDRWGEVEDSELHLYLFLRSLRSGRASSEPFLGPRRWGLTHHGPLRRSLTFLIDSARCRPPRRPCPLG